MNLISDLGNDLAMAFFVNEQHREKLDKKEVLALMDNVQKALQKVSYKRTRHFGTADVNKNSSKTEVHA